MRISYVCHWNPAADGVVTKIEDQVAAWRQLGAEAEVFRLKRASDDVLRDGWNTFLYRRPLVGRALATRDLTRAVARHRPDVVYLRFSLFVPPPHGLLQRIPTVVEINSNDRSEYRLKGARVWIPNELNRRLVLGGAAGLVFVTAELAASPDFRAFDKPRVVIPNGIAFDGRLPLPAPRNTRARAAFLAGSAGIWHGVDKLLALARALPEFDFEIIGAADVSCQPLPTNVRCHRLLGRADYEAILAGCDVAFGTLALHRKGMNEAAPLKVREYLLHGLPIVIGYDDPALADSDWFVLRLPNCESNVADNVEAIRRFVLASAGKRVPREIVEPRIAIARAETARLEFIAAAAKSLFR